MIKEGNDSKAIHSSIALLQERFRQLQREKEMRKERELLQRLNTAHHFDKSPGFSLSPELSISPPSSSPQVSLSLWPSWLSKPAVADHKKIEAPLLIDLWPSSNVSVPRSALSSKCDDYVHDDVDTSLHL